MNAKQLGSVAFLHFHVAGMLGIIPHIERKLSFELCIIWKIYDVEIVKKHARTSRDGREKLSYSSGIFPD
jgi:hypothetical protein